MSGDDDDETLIASKDWLPPDLGRPRPAAGAAPYGFPGAENTLPLAPAVTPPAAALAPAVEAPGAALGTPPFVMTFLLVCGVLTALGLIALIYLEM